MLSDTGNREHHIGRPSLSNAMMRRPKVPTSKRTMSLTCDALGDQLDNRD